MRKHLFRAVLGLTTAALVGGTLTTPAQAATPRADSAATWLADQLDGGLVVSEYNLHDGNGWQSYIDYGLTLDVFYAFDALDVRAGKRRRILDALEPRMEKYTAPFGTTYAGAVGKLLTAVRREGVAPAGYGDGTLLSTLEALVVAGGPQKGRAKDAGGPDTSNTFGQAYVVTALARSRSDLEAEAAAFLRKQQCDAGFFRQAMESADFTCDGGTAAQRRPSVDATATAALALLEAAPRLAPRPRDRARAAARDAVRWLVSRQAPSGTFAGGRNTNATGLAATALGVAGKAARAARAAGWVRRHQVTGRVVRSTGYRVRDLGAVAYDRDAFSDGRAAGISRDERYVWRRATAQAAPALDYLR